MLNDFRQEDVFKLDIAVLLEGFDLLGTHGIGGVELLLQGGLGWGERHG